MDFEIRELSCHIAKEHILKNWNDPGEKNPSEFVSKNDAMSGRPSTCFRARSDYKYGGTFRSMLAQCSNYFVER